LRSARYARHRSTSPAGVGWEQPESKLQKASYTGWAKAVAGYKITQKEVFAEDEVHLHISAPLSPEGLRNGRVILIMRKIGSDWKQAGPRD